MIILCTILVLFNLITVYVVYNLLRKNESLEDIVLKQETYIDRISSIIEESSKKLEEIDQKGTFKSDDEIGWFFNSIKLIQNILDNFKLTQNN